MMIIFYLLLMLQFGRSTDNQNFETKIVGAGENVILTCTHQATGDIETLFWIKLVIGKLPEIMGKAYSFDYDAGNVISHITTKKEPGKFLLNITKAKLSDTGFFYCFKSHSLNVTFLKGTFLRIKGSEPDITKIIQDFPADPVHPGDSVTLNCSVLFDSVKKTCPEDHSVYWFRVALDESHSNLIYAQGNSSNQCKQSPEGHSPQKCVYSFSRSISFSDAGTYYCAVAACGEILFGNGTKLDIEVVSEGDSQGNTVLFLLCAALAISLFVIVFLVCVIMKTSCECCNAAANSGSQQSHQRNEDNLVYSLATFNRIQTRKAGKRNAPIKEDTIYTDVRAFVID